MKVSVLSRLLLGTLAISGTLARAQTQAAPRDVLLYLGQFDADDEQLLELVDREGELLPPPNASVSDAPVSNAKGSANKAQNAKTQVEMPVNPEQVKPDE